MVCALKVNRYIFTVCFPIHQALFEKIRSLTGKYLFPVGAHSILLEKILFQKGGKTIVAELPALNVYPNLLSNGYMINIKDIKSMNVNQIQCMILP